MIETINTITTGRCGNHRPHIFDRYNGNGQICGNGQIDKSKSNGGYDTMTNECPMERWVDEPMCGTCDIYDVCESRICDNHVVHTPYRLTHTHTVNELINEPNLTVARIDNRLTIAIAHDGSIDEPTNVIDDIVDMIDRFRLNGVTCMTIVCTPHIAYNVHPVTPSGTVWHITVNAIDQIAMGLNAIGTRMGV